MVLYTMIAVPYLVCFKDYGDEFIPIEIIISIFYCLDIILYFNITTTNSKLEMLYDRKQIAKEYLKRTFILDLISMLPLYIMTNQAYLIILRYPKLIKLYINVWQKIEYRYM